VRRLQLASWPAAIGFGIGAELIGRPPLPLLDAATGFGLAVVGLLAWRAQPRHLLGPVAVGAGFAWFLGTLADQFVYLHRAPLAQLILTYPETRRRPAAREWVWLAAVYGYALTDTLAGNDRVTIAFALAVATAALARLRLARGARRRTSATALAAALIYATALITPAALRLAGVKTGSATLAGYEIGVLLCTALFGVDLLRGGWAQATMTSVVVDLGESTETGTLRDRLARTLADPLIEIGFWIPSQGAYVDEGGRALALPTADPCRAVHVINDAGEPVAALVHDPAALVEPALLAGIDAAVSLRVANARLQAEVRARSDEVRDSRRRLLETADRQRAQLAGELRRGAAQRLTEIRALLHDSGPPLADAAAAAAGAGTQLDELARGIHPSTLTEHGIAAALQELANRSPIPVEIVCTGDRWPGALEAAAYFICSEALTNVAKYARAGRAMIEATADDDVLRIVVADDGVGGASPTAGSGLRGMRDRAEALGGDLGITSPPNGGTRVSAWFPLTR
jgi:signal transduction histidine kinase